MSTKTLGTAAQTTLVAVPFSRGLDLSDADIATIANSIKNDQNVTAPIYAGAFARTGFLFIPNRGLLKMLPGDYVGVDSTGWPILVSKGAAASGSWVHT